MTCSVVFNADDFGFCGLRNAGILQSATRGVVRSATVLLSGTAVSEALRAGLLVLLFEIPCLTFFVNFCPFFFFPIYDMKGRAADLSLGLHLNLTEGRPVSAPATIPTLCEPWTGCFRGKTCFLRAVLAGEVDTRDVYTELCAQLQFFTALKNDTLPTHLDGHNHVHVFPGVARVVAQLAAEFSISRLRLPIPPSPDPNLSVF